MDAEKCTTTLEIILNANDLSLLFLVNHNSSVFYVLLIQYLLPLSRSPCFQTLQTLYLILDPDNNGESTFYLTVQIITHRKEGKTIGRLIQAPYLKLSHTDLILTTTWAGRLIESRHVAEARRVVSDRGEIETPCSPIPKSVLNSYCLHRDINSMCY